MHHVIEFNQSQCLNPFIEFNALKFWQQQRNV